MLTKRQLDNCAIGLVDCGTVHFNLSHYNKVRKAREEAGLPIADLNPDFDHPLIGRKILRKSTGITYEIKSCKKQWLLGWFYGFIIEQEGGSGNFIYWELDKETPSHYSIVRDSISENEKDYELLEEV